MKRNTLLSAILTLMLSGIVFGCGSPAPTPTAGTKSGFNLLVVAEGRVQLRRSHWNEFHPTGFGVRLYPGDQLKPEPGATAVVLCDNLVPWTVPAGEPSGLNNGCPGGQEPVLVRSGGLIGNTRGGTDPLIPFLISPRATKVLDATPVLRWNKVPGATSYKVQLSGVDWKETVTGTEMTYPGNPPLQTGTTYLLIVDSDNGKSSKDEGLPGLGFSLLDEAEAQRVRANAETTSKLAISDEAKTYVVAQLYASHGLYADAIQALESLANAGSQNANVYRSLGDLYRAVGLPPLAEKPYSQAIQLAMAAGDLETQAGSQASLGEVFKEQGKKDKAADQFKAAKAGYTTLGDAQQASQIAEQLAELTQ